MVQQTVIDDKQFLISDAAYSGWNSIKLYNGKVLSYQNKLHVAFNNAKSVVLIGDAWQSDEKQKQPNEIIQEIAYDSMDETVYKIEESWAGRYVLIVGDRIFQDCTSQLCTFYDKNYNISSSLRILVKINGLTTKYPKIRHGVGFNYFPGPLTPYNGIKKVLCSQVLNYMTGEIYGRPLFVSDLSQCSNLTEEFSNRFVYSLKKMQEVLDGDIKVALTGGYDSRTLLSLLHKSGVEFSCYTFETEFNKTGGDFELPQILCKKLGGGIASVN